MDVVPADPSRWSRDPFGAEVADGKLWGRGSIDMKGIGRHPALRVHRAPSTARAAQARRAADGRARRRSGRRAGRRVDAQDPLRRARSRSTCSTKEGFGSRDMFAAGKLVFGISVAEKKIMWLRLRAEGVVRPRIAAARPEPQRSSDGGAHRLMSEPMPSAPFAVIDTMKQRVGTAGGQQVQQRDPEVDDLAHQPEVGRRRAAEGQRDSRRWPRRRSTAACCRGPRPRNGSRRSSERLADPTIKIEVINEGPRPGGHVHRTRPFYRALESAVKPPPSRRDRDADGGPLRHRRERLSRARRQELRLLSRASCPPRRLPRCTATPSSCRSTRSARRSRSSTKRWSRPSSE